MEQHTEVFVGLDVAKLHHAVAIAESGRDGEVRFFGEINSDAESMRRMVAKLMKRHSRFNFAMRLGQPATGCIGNLRNWGINAPSLRLH